MSAPVRPSLSLSAQVAEEIRVLLTRRRMSARQLAALLDVSPSWLSYRLTGAQPIDLDDLQRIAAALGVDPMTLIPAGQGRRATTIEYPHISQPAKTGKPTRRRWRAAPHNDRPMAKAGPPKGHPQRRVTAPSPRRPAILSRAAMANA